MPDLFFFQAIIFIIILINCVVKDYPSDVLNILSCVLIFFEFSEA